MGDRRTFVSVDLDDPGCYHAIHGLSPPRPEHRGIVLERCLPRFLELFAKLGVRATFFVIGRDLDRDRRQHGRGADLLRQALGEGHELANHSHAHDYALTRRSAEAMRRDIEACDVLLRDLGADVRGFRAPGYTHDARLLAQVRAVGYAYDSSMLPSPPYYAAKVGIIAGARVLGRRSASSVRGGASFFGPRVRHYRVDAGLWELPISVSPVLRLPLIGTSLLSTPEALARRLRRSALALDELHLELHGIDLADPERDGFAPELVARQPELRTSLVRRRDALAELLRARGPTTRLRDVAGDPPP